MKNRLVLEIHNYGFPSIQQIYYNTLVLGGRKAIAEIFFHGYPSTLKAYVVAKNPQHPLESSKIVKEENFNLENAKKTLTIKTAKYSLEEMTIQKADKKPESNKDQDGILLSFTTQFTHKYFAIGNAFLALEYNKTIVPYNFVDLNLDLGLPGNTKESSIDFRWELYF